MSFRLAALRIERRRISVAILEDSRLDYTANRELPSILTKAVESSCAYVDWITRSFSLSGVVLEKNGSDQTTWKATITTAIRQQLRQAGVPIFESYKSDVISSFGHPALRHRTELRKVICKIWPMLSTKEKDAACLDAAALGLYVQVQRYFVGE